MLHSENYLLSNHCIIPERQEHGNVCSYRNRFLPINQFYSRYHAGDEVEGCGLQDGQVDISVEEEYNL